MERTTNNRTGSLFVAVGMGMAAMPLTAGFNRAFAQGTAPSTPAAPDTVYSRDGMQALKAQKKNEAIQADMAALAPAAQIKADLSMINAAMSKLGNLPPESIAAALDPIRISICDDTPLRGITAACSANPDTPAKSIANSLGVISAAAFNALESPAALRAFNGGAQAISVTATMGGIKSLQETIPPQANGSFFKKPAAGN